MDRKAKSAANRAINVAFRALPNMWKGFQSGKDLLFSECLASEKQHRRHAPVVEGFSASDAARYFTVKYLYELLTDVRAVPDVADYLSLRHEIFTAAALVANFQDKLTEEWFKPRRADIEAVLHLDYVDLME